MPQTNFERAQAAAATAGKHAEASALGRAVDLMSDAEVRSALEQVRSSPIGDFLAGQARSITELLDRADTAPPVEVRYAGGDRENPRVTPAPPPTASIRLSRELMALGNTPQVTGVSYAGVPSDQPGEVVPLRAQLMERSVFAAMGGHVILDEPVPLALKEQAGHQSREVLVERPRQLRVITPLQFTKQTAAGQEAPVSAWPGVSSDLVGGVTSALPGSAFMDTYLTRVRLTRRQQALLPRQLWAFEVCVALADGLARLADSVAFGRLENFLTAAPFSLGGFAAKGVAHETLKAALGTSATGAQVRQDGVLTYAGICEAALTPMTASTLVGDWSRAAVFVRDDITLVAKHDSTSGDLDLTASRVTAARRSCI